MYSYGSRKSEDKVVIRETFSEEETIALARDLGSKAVPGQVYRLDGDLGAGKTVFARGFAEGLGITEPVSSPTFQILKEYHTGRIPFYHYDVYRLSDESEMDEIGYEDAFYGAGVSLVEWPERIETLFPEKCIDIKIETDPGKGFDYRRISIEGLQDQ